MRYAAGVRTRRIGVAGFQLPVPGFGFPVSSSVPGFYHPRELAMKNILLILLLPGSNFRPEVRSFRFSDLARFPIRPMPKSVAGIQFPVSGFVSRASTAKRIHPYCFAGPSFRVRTPLSSPFSFSLSFAFSGSPSSFSSHSTRAADSLASRCSLSVRRA